MTALLHRLAAWVCARYGPCQWAVDTDEDGGE